MPGDLGGAAQAGSRGGAAEGRGVCLAERMIGMRIVTPDLVALRVAEASILPAVTAAQMVALRPLLKACWIDGVPAVKKGRVAVFGLGLAFDGLMSLIKDHYHPLRFAELISDQEGTSAFWGADCGNCMGWAFGIKRGGGCSIGRGGEFLQEDWLHRIRLLGDGIIEDREFFTLLSKKEIRLRVLGQASEPAPSPAESGR